MRGDQPVVCAASLMVSASTERQPYHDRVKVYRRRLQAREQGDAVAVGVLDAGQALAPDLVRRLVDDGDPGAAQVLDRVVAVAGVDAQLERRVGARRGRRVDPEAELALAEGQRHVRRVAVGREAERLDRTEQAAVEAQRAVEVGDDEDREGLGEREPVAGAHGVSPAASRTAWRASWP